MIFEAIGPFSAIGKVAMSETLAALDAGFQVTVVAKRLDESLHDRVDWRKLYCPPRGFALQWLTARHFIKSAIGNQRFDVVHGHQPQIASLCDVFQCHFLTRMAYQRGCLETGRNLRARLVRAQQQAVLHAEDFYYRHWDPQTLMLFDSAMTREDFHQLYGALPREDVLLYDCPPANPTSDQERCQARRQWLGGDEPRLVVGYIGGLHERKGYRRLERAVLEDDSLFLLMGGPFSEKYAAAGLTGRVRGVGLVRDTASFYAACDVLVVPSRYEPFGLVTYEAAVRGIPVIATQEVGALPHLLAYGAGMAWDPDQPLGPLVRRAVAERHLFQKGARRMAAELSHAQMSVRLISFYERVMTRKAAVREADAGGFLAPRPARP
jgi:glycosyltransferase involved in cell wall biosynthesis